MWKLIIWGWWKKCNLREIQEGKGWSEGLMVNGASDSFWLVPVNLNIVPKSLHEMVLSFYSITSNRNEDEVNSPCSMLSPGMGNDRKLSFSDFPGHNQNCEYRIGWENGVLLCTTILIDELKTSSNTDGAKSLKVDMPGLWVRIKEDESMKFLALVKNIKPQNPI